MGALQLAELVDIQAASAADALEIYALATSLFGAKQFLYTIYQAPQSVRHLAKLIDAANPANPFFALKLNGRLIGYYEAIMNSGVCFLNYIGVDNSVAGNGYGNLLLTHFTGLARDRGCSELSLDVFESNPRAVSWYSRAGFQPQGKKYFTRLALGGDSPTLAAECIVDREELEAALAHEAVHGFSKLSCHSKNQTVVVGLIGGHSCKLLGLGGLEIAEAIDCVVPHMQKTRQILIASSDTPIRSKLSVVTSETVLRLRKQLN